MYEWETHECTVNILYLFLSCSVSLLSHELAFCVCMCVCAESGAVSKKMSNDLRLLHYRAIWHFPNRTSQMARMIFWPCVYVYMYTLFSQAIEFVVFLYFELAIITPSTLISCWLIECNLLTHNIIILNRRFSSVHRSCLHLRRTWEKHTPNYQLYLDSTYRNGTKRREFKKYREWQQQQQPRQEKRKRERKRKTWTKYIHLY